MFMRSSVCGRFTNVARCTNSIGSLQNVPKCDRRLGIFRSHTESTSTLKGFWKRDLSFACLGYTPLFGRKLWRYVSFFLPQDTRHPFQKQQDIGFGCGMSLCLISGTQRCQKLLPYAGRLFLCFRPCWSPHLDFICAPPNLLLITDVPFRPNTQNRSFKQQGLTSSQRAPPFLQGLAPPNTTPGKSKMQFPFAFLRQLGSSIGQRSKIWSSGTLS